MDRQCRVCKKTFNFDVEGLETFKEGEQFLVCDVECAKKAATAKGNTYAIHDKSDAIVGHNIPIEPYAQQEKLLDDAPIGKSVLDWLLRRDYDSIGRRSPYDASHVHRNMHLRICYPGFLHHHRS